MRTCRASSSEEARLMEIYCKSCERKLEPEELSLAAETAKCRARGAEFGIGEDLAWRYRALKAERVAGLPPDLPLPDPRSRSEATWGALRPSLRAACPVGRWQRSRHPQGLPQSGSCTPPRESDRGDSPHRGSGGAGRDAPGRYQITGASRRVTRSHRVIGPHRVMRSRPIRGPWRRMCRPVRRRRYRSRAGTSGPAGPTSRG